MSAIISACGCYRYLLTRDLSDNCHKAVAWIMVNPSTADDVTDDATIRKVKGFTERLGYGRIVVGNLFAYRATNVKDLRKVEDPIGPANNEYLHSMIQEAELIICAWGPIAKLPPKHKLRWTYMLRMASREKKWLHCLGTSKDGQPRHPLMLPYSSELQLWTPELI